jgi:Rad3-related DNA helicase
MKNYVNHEKLADDFLVERNHTDIVVIHEKHNLNWEIIDYSGSNVVCFMCRDSILSLQARKQYVWG